MNSEETLFNQALSIAAQERSAFLDNACAADPALRQRIESLLAAHEKAGPFLESPPTDLAPTSTEPHPAPAERPGQSVGPYKLLEQIGEGGMGVVFMAEQTHPVRRKVALKIIKPGMDTRQVIARFEAERQALALMDHPNIAKILEVGATDTGRPYFVMELVRGVPITEYCDQQKLAPRQRLDLFAQVCQAVQHAHQKGIIHRDLKPKNVLVTLQDGKPSPKIIDFGIAKATAGQPLTDLTLFTELRQLIGTPLYMSPEQAETRALMDVDTRSDVYSLGVLLYELLTGATPFDKNRLAKAAYEEVRRIIREEDPPRPSTRISTLGDTLTSVAAHRQTDPQKLSTLLRGELDWIVMRAMEKDRTRRYPTASELAQDVHRFLSDQPVEACPPSRLYRVRKFACRNKATIATSSIIAAVLVIATAVSTWQAVVATGARNQLALEQRRVLDEKLRADEQAAVAEAVNTFFRTNVLEQADPEMRTPSTAPNPNLTVREALDRAANNVAGNFDKHPLVEAAISRTIGNAYLDLGQLDKAESHLRSAVRLYEQVLGPSHAQTLAAINALANVYSAERNYGKAEHLYSQILDSTRASGDPSDPAIAAICNLGSLYQDQGKWAKAQPLIIRGLELLRKAHGDMDRRTLDVLDNLAVNYQHLHQFRQAEELYSKALAGQRKVLGESKPATLRTLANLANFYFDRGRYKDAEPLYALALGGERALRGEQDPRVFDLMKALAWTHYNQQDYAGAKRVREEQLAIAKRTWGEQSQQAARVLIELGYLVLTEGREDEGEGMLRQAIAMQQKATGAESPELGEALALVAYRYHNRQRDDEAEKLSRQAIPLLRKLDASSYLPIALDIVAARDRERGEFAKAQDEYKESLAVRRKVYGDEATETLEAMDRLAQFLEDRKQYAEAELLISQSLAISESTLGTDPPDAGGKLIRLGNVLRAQGRYDDATKRYLTAIALLRKLDDKRHLADALHQLGHVANRQHDPTRAEKLYREAFEIRDQGHFEVGYSLIALGNLMRSQKNYPEAETFYRRGLALQEQGHEPGLPDKASLRTMLAEVLSLQGKPLDALAEQTPPGTTPATRPASATARADQPGGSK